MTHARSGAHRTPLAARARDLAFGRAFQELYRSGITSQMLSVFRRLSGVDEGWLRWASSLDAAGRAAAVETTLGRCSARPCRARGSPRRVSSSRPPYLRRDRFERAKEAPTRVSYRRENVLRILSDAPRHSYTHHSFLDAPDWLDAATQRRLLDGVLRTARDGARVVTRSVEDECMVERAGLSGRIRRLDDASERATRADRTRQYRRVHVYEMHA